MSYLRFFVQIDIREPLPNGNWIAQRERYHQLIVRLMKRALKQVPNKTAWNVAGESYNYPPPMGRERDHYA